VTDRTAINRIILQIDLYLETGNREYLREAKAIGDCLLHRPLPELKAYERKLPDWGKSQLIEV